jgi:acetyl coenzyme A synthetase (ADP forming)-like protein
MRVAAPPPTPLDGPPNAPLVLRDGTVVSVRAAGPADRAAVRAFIERLSPESRYRRFLTAGRPSDRVVDSLCATADPARTVTLVASRSIGGAERLLGMASYTAVNRTVAEVAFAVDDQFGQLGIATGLLEHLAGLAGSAGFERFQAITLRDNASMLSVFRDSGFTIRSRIDGDSVHVELSLQPSSETVAACQDRERQATVASIRPLLEPASVAVVGASRDPSAIGRRILDALLMQRYAGALYAVNPNARSIAGVAVAATVRDLPRGVDLAIVAVPRDAVPKVVDDCASAGVRSLLVITAGFAEAGDEGRARQQQLLDQVRSYGLRMVGPNCMGLLNTHLKLNASFSPIFPPSGRVGFSSQSGALGMAILALAAERNVGLSTFVSVGNKADVSSNDLLQYWEQDPSTAVILLYLESFGNPRRFGRLARRIGRQKPIVAVKAGRTRAGRLAAGSHTAALAANDVAVDALLHQAGVIRADTIDEMFDVAVCLDTQPLPIGRRVVIISNAGGPGILAADACDAAGLTAPELSAATQAGLSVFLPSVASLANPVDMVASAGPDEYRLAIEVALSAPETDALLVLYTPVDAFRSAAILEAIAQGIAAGRRAGGQGKPIVACLMGQAGRPVPLAVDGERVPTYAFPENAIRALGKAARYAEWRARPPGLFWSFNDIRADQARQLCRDVAAARGQDWLTPDELGRVATDLGLPLVAGVLARSGDEAASLASVVGFPVVAKLSAPRVVHKTEIDGVRLNLASPAAVRNAFADLTAAARQHGVDRVEGVLIQPMIGGGIETIVGLVDDPTFGPLVGAGLGGVQVEALGGMRFRVAPLTDRDADELVHEMRGFALLDGYRGKPRADIDAFIDTILRVSRLAEEVPEVIELDLNPVIVLPQGQGCRIVDARLRVGPSPRHGRAAGLKSEVREPLAPLEPLEPLEPRSTTGR